MLKLKLLSPKDQVQGNLISDAFLPSSTLQMQMCLSAVLRPRSGDVRLLRVNQLFFLSPPTFWELCPITCLAQLSVCRDRLPLAPTQSSCDVRPRPARPRTNVATEGVFTGDYMS